MSLDRKIMATLRDLGCCRLPVPALAASESTYEESRTQWVQQHPPGAQDQATWTQESKVHYNEIRKRQKRTSAGRTEWDTGNDHIPVRIQVRIKWSRSMLGIYTIIKDRALKVGHLTSPSGCWPIIQGLTFIMGMAFQCHHSILSGHW